MFKITKLFHHRPGVDDGARARLADDLRRTAALAGAHRALIQPTLPGVRNGGDLLAHLQFDAEDRWRAAEPAVDALLDPSVVDHVDGAEYRGEPRGQLGVGAEGGVYRALLLRVDPSAADTVVERFEAELLRMPRHVPAIRAWQLSRVSRAEGASPWTHVWEQEFTDLQGLMGPYLAHPVHWAYIDRWFDPECPDVIVRDRVCHSFCALDGSVV
ncbi:stress responsive A/B Barrel domain protein [Rhodococcus sp. MTM3W5.2]|uniref:Dabb family protein n=1 Tax=Rhodococcus sp. MTM3W5.2 TaxID=1805827 RepID=UPI000979849D|nr:Dabb family protein [Rhodococcus sp. MTM3W5.2]AQA25003.1 stress responsive A/B Barrel domain protein [Rhodococcus sp. MTM3W5.2]